MFAQFPFRILINYSIVVSTFRQSCCCELQQFFTSSNLFLLPRKHWNLSLFSNWIAQSLRKLWNRSGALGVTCNTEEIDAVCLHARNTAENRARDWLCSASQLVPMRAKIHWVGSRRAAVSGKQKHDVDYINRIQQQTSKRFKATFCNDASLHHQKPIHQLASSDDSGFSDSPRRENLTDFPLLLIAFR